MEKDKQKQGDFQSINVVPATDSDSKDIWEWRNDQITIQMSETMKSISWETHCSWYEKSLLNQSRFLYLGVLNGGEKIGMCRLDFNAYSNTAEVSINLNPKFRGKKLSAQLLSQVIAEFLNKQNVNLTAKIEKTNIASIKCFIKNGFIFIREDGFFKHYARKVKKDAINVRYIYSACVITTTPDLSILHDPWFTEGIYDGSWFQFPKIDKPLDSIGDVDYIFISHIHPDHYDPYFLKEYFKKFGTKKILIADHFPNHLAGKMRADGIDPTILTDALIIGNTTVEIVPHKTGSFSDIDSALVLKYKSSEKLHCLVNANDINFDEEMRNTLKSVANEVDILLCGYTGAGPYPQTYFEASDLQLRLEADKKKLAFFERYKTLVRTIDAKVNIPFAGKYILGGRHVELNEFRGVADSTEVLEFDKNAVVLADNYGEIDSGTLTPNLSRKYKYDYFEVRKRMEEIKAFRMDYERLISEEEVDQLPLKRLLITATRNAVRKSECEQDYYFCISLTHDQLAVVNANKNSLKSLFFVDKFAPLPVPRSEIIIDPRYLFGLLTNVYHWNNAEVGSQYYTRRTPNTLNRNAQTFLNYLSI